MTGPDKLAIISAVAVVAWAALGYLFHKWAGYRWERRR